MLFIIIFLLFPPPPLALRALIFRLEKEDFLPSIPQLEALCEALGFEPDEVFVDNTNTKLASPAPLNIAVAGTGYVGLSIATLLAQHNHVTSVDIIPEKVEQVSIISGHYSKIPNLLNIASKYSPP